MASERAKVAWAKRVVVVLAVVSGLVFLWRGLAILAVVIVIVGIGTYAGNRWRKWRAVRRFRSVWGTQGKDLLLVYSNSPHWQRYVEETWLPKWGRRAVVLNWSERSGWSRSNAEVALFRAFAGAREFNPLGIVVPAIGRHVDVVRFWRAFKDFKHGKDRRLREAEAELERYLEATRGVRPARANPPLPKVR